MTVLRCRLSAKIPSPTHVRAPASRRSRVRRSPKERLRWLMRASIPTRQLFHLRTDPFERADTTSNTYYDWFLDNDYIALAAPAVMAQFLATFKDFPPRQKAASFTIDQVVAKLENALTSGR
jgi:hypothetical protein